MGGFDVEDDVVGFEDGSYVHSFEGFVCYSGDGCIELLVGGEFVDNVEAVFVTHGCRVCPGVKDSDVEVILFEGFDDVYDLGVAHVGAVLLEGEAEDNDMATEYLNAFLEHEFDNSVGNVSAHTIVHAATGEDDFGVVAVALCALCKVVGIDTDAVTSNESGFERQEVPLG